MVVPLDFLSELINFITNGTIIGLPTIATMAVPLIIGIVIGFMLKKVLKWAIIIGVVVAALAYFGIWGLSFDKLQMWGETYGALAVQQALLMVGVLPLGIGFIIGVILGFILA